MGFFALLLLAVGLSADAFAVSVCKGLSLKRVTLKKALTCGIWFGSFQALMPFIGYILGSRFEHYVHAFAPWIAFFLLVIIGGNMIKEARANSDESASSRLDIKTMFMLAVATSIDALAVGITFACVNLSILPASQFVNAFAGIVIIGITTFIISSIGVWIGNIFGTKYKSKAEILGGVILILIGLKILLEAFGVF